jgi:hypothetical protein
VFLSVVARSAILRNLDFHRKGSPRMAVLTTTAKRLEDLHESPTADA